MVLFHKKYLQTKTKKQKNKKTKKQKQLFFFVI